MNLKITLIGHLFWTVIGMFPLTYGSKLLFFAVHLMVVVYPQLHTISLPWLVAR